jgi:undecaprenyl diphosphate synthase
MLSDFSGVVQNGSRDEALLAAIAWDRLPRHIAIIMDGNGRWAAQRGQPRIAGHKAGVEAVRAAVDTGARLGIGALTLYAFST